MQRVVDLARTLLSAAVRYLSRPGNMDDQDRLIIPMEKFVGNLPTNSRGIIDRYAIFKNYYEYYREEVKREDEITFQRLNLTLLFQGFLFTAIVIVLGQSRALNTGVADDTPEITFDPFFLVPSLAICVVGFSVALFSFYGIDSARRSLAFSKSQWVMFNRINGMMYPSLFPQPIKRANRLLFEEPGTKLTREELLEIKDIKNFTGREEYRDEGWDFVLAMPLLLMAVWSLLAFFIAIMVLSGFKTFISVLILAFTFWIITSAIRLDYKS